MGVKRDPEAIRVAVGDFVQELAPRKDGLFDSRLSLAGDLGFESIDLIELGVAIEEEFDIELLQNPAAKNLVTVADLQDAVVEIVTGELR